MGKHAFGSPKYIANKIKAKGLQKLRFYCQMCQKQCRDQNGFKCHTASQSHQRQMLIFSDNADKYIDEFSEEFSNRFLELLQRQYGTKRVKANKVHQDYIKDRHHVHMNATQWATLSDFVQYLGRESKCVVEEEPGMGWYIKFIERDPAMIALQTKLAKKSKMIKNDEEKQQEFFEKQVASGMKNSNSSEVPVPPVPLMPENRMEKLALQIISKKREGFVPLKRSSSTLELSEEKFRRKKVKGDGKSEENCTEDGRLVEDIVVKIVTKSRGDEYYGKKGYVTKVIDKYGAIVKMIDCNKKLLLDQNHLETVVPKLGGLVKVLYGSFKGSTVKLLDLNAEKFCVKLKIVSDEFKDEILDEVPYEKVSKLPFQ